MYVAVFAAEGFGQGREITEQEYKELTANTLGFLRTVSNRSKRVAEIARQCNTAKCEWAPWFETHVEFVPPASLRTVIFDNGKTEPTEETIFVGGRKYIKTDIRGWRLAELPSSVPRAPEMKEALPPWVELPSEKNGSETVRVFSKKEVRTMRTFDGEYREFTETKRNWYNGAGKLIKSETITLEGAKTSTITNVFTYRFLELPTEKIGYETVRVFMKEERMQVSDGYESVETTRSWINTAGNLMKLEKMETRSRSNPSRVVTTYEIDPNIKIEAPIP